MAIMEPQAFVIPIKIAVEGGPALIEFNETLRQTAIREGDEEDRYIAEYTCMESWRIAGQDEMVLEMARNMLGLDVCEPYFAGLAASSFLTLRRDYDVGIELVKQGLTAVAGLPDLHDRCWLTIFLKSKELALEVAINPASERSVDVLTELSSFAAMWFVDRDEVLTCLEQMAKYHVLPNRSRDLLSLLWKSFAHQQRTTTGLDTYVQRIEGLEKLLPSYHDVPW